MTMESLESDMKEISDAARKLGPLTSAAELAAFIKSNLVPFIENHVAESSEMSGALDDLIENADDILQPETAQIFMGVITGGSVMAMKVRELLPKTPDGKLADQGFAQALAEYEGLLMQAKGVLEEITLPIDPDDVDDPDAGEDDEDDEDEDEDGEDDDTEGAE